MDEIMLSECSWNADDVQAVAEECERLGLNSNVVLETESSDEDHESSSSSWDDMANEDETSHREPDIGPLGGSLRLADVSP